MRLFLLGATGGTGTAIRDQAVRRGHAVTAFGRSKANDLVGSPVDASVLAEGMKGHDAVLSAIGGGLFATTIRTDSARAILDAMLQSGIRRFIVMSSTLNEPLLRSRILSHTLLWAPAKDQRAMEGIIAASDAGWTIIRPPLLTNGALTGDAQLAETNRGRSSVSRADVARLMLDLAEGGSHQRQVVWVA
ncbi:MAG: NAD(P)-dependent oxidoreductase [Thermoanaerobaculia bacterium]